MVMENYNLKLAQRITLSIFNGLGSQRQLSRPLGEVVNHGREFPDDKQIPEVVEEMKNRASLSLDAVADEVANKEYLVANSFLPLIS